MGKKEALDVLCPMRKFLKDKVNFTPLGQIEARKMEKYFEGLEKDAVASRELIKELEHKLDCLYKF